MFYAYAGKFYVIENFANFLMKTKQPLGREGKNKEMLLPPPLKFSEHTCVRPGADKKN
jgi:hypothetical protein